jgi:hypothetical protein
LLEPRIALSDFTHTDASGGDPGTSGGMASEADSRSL